MEGTRAAGRRPFMPASRILEGSLPEQQPKGPDFFWRPTTTQNGARPGYQGQSPCLVRRICQPSYKSPGKRVFAGLEHIPVTSCPGLNSVPCCSPLTLGSDRQI